MTETRKKQGLCQVHVVLLLFRVNILSYSSLIGWIEVIKVIIQVTTGNPRINELTTLLPFMVNE